MSKIGKYELISEIGSGSMGSVYLAVDPMLDRQVALKRILPGTQLDNELRERFIREARACAKLQHPSIVTIFDLGEEERGGAYIAMEYLQGTDLRRIIAERRPIPLAQRVEMICQLADALHHAHRAGIVHRDIKPSNLFLVTDGRAKIIDFGIARLAASNFTMTGRVLGTPNYMAPEQIQGKPCDGRSDLFSLAIVAFEFLVYAHPFQGESIPRRIVRENPDSLLVYDPDLPPELGQVIERALQKDPAQRYATCGAFVSALRKAMGGSTSGSQVDVRLDEELPDTGPIPGTEEEQISASVRAFDDAVVRGEVTHARLAFKEIERVASVDVRFRDLLTTTRQRLQALERHASEDQTVIDPVPPPAPSTGSSTATRITAPPPAPAPAAKKTGNRLPLVLAAVAILAGGTWFALRPKAPPPAPDKPVVGVARVAAAEAELHQSPGGPKTGALRKGESVSLVSLPAARTDEWIQTTAGYARVADLEGWEAKAPQDQFTLLKAFAPAADASDADRRAWAERLAALAETNGIPQAALQAASAFAELSKKPSADAALKALAEKALAQAEKDESSKAEAAALRKRLADSGSPADSAEKEVATNLASAQYFHSRGRYAEAEAMLMKVLQAQPSNAKAQQLLQAVRNAKRDEELLFKK